MKIDLSEFTPQKLLETAMVMQNLQYMAAKVATMEKFTDRKEIRMEADYHAPANEYLKALEPYYIKYDADDGEPYNGYTSLRSAEFRTLKMLFVEGVAHFTVHVGDKSYLLGVNMQGNSDYYDVVILTDIFTNFYNRVIKAARAVATVPAKLSFINFTTPIVSVGDQSYTLSTMRNGHAFEIIEFCYNEHPGVVVRMPTLKEAISLKGVPSITVAFKNSLFDSTKGLLRSFAEVNPQIIRVHKIVQLPLAQLDDIIAASKTT